MPRRPRTTGAAMLAAAMTGLHDAIYGRQHDEIAVVVDAGGDPPPPDGLALELTDDPQTSKARFRRS